MNILFLTYDFPYPTNSGGKSRAYNLLKFAKGENTIILFSFTRDDYREEYKKEIEKLGIQKIYTVKRKRLKSLKTLISLKLFHSIFKSLYFDIKIEDQVNEIIEKESIDVLHCESFYTGFYIKPREIKQIFGSENIEYKLYKDYVDTQVAPHLKPFYDYQVQRVQLEEMKMAKNADITLAVTPKEAQYFEKITHKPPAVIPNGVDTDFFAYKQKKTNTKKLLFIGNFSYFPNRDAIEHFYKDIFKSLDNDVELIIVGKKSELLSIKNDPRVTIHDYVEDIREMYYEADIFISPIRIGGGTNFKVIESMSCGTPVIGYKDRMDALKITHNNQALVATSKEEFKHYVEELLSDEKKRERLAKQARTFIEETYSWKIIGKELQAIWEEK